MMFFSILHQNMPQKPPKEGVLSHCEATLPHVFSNVGSLTIQSFCFIATATIFIVR